MRLIKNLVFTFIALMGLFSLPIQADHRSDGFSTQPVLNQGQRWRIGYYEGGEYSEYPKLFVATIKGMMRLGWIEPREIPVALRERTAGLWQWLASSVKSDYLTFVPDAYYSAQWDEGVRLKMARTAIARLNGRQDIDMMIAMGTWAGQDLANNRHKTATMVISSSDPLAAGIIKSAEDSGYRHVNATVDPSLHERQLRVFHDLVSFKRLGVAYENTVSGRSYAAIEDIEAQAARLGFEIVPCYTRSDVIEVSIAERSVIDCFQRLSPQVEAIYVTSQGGVTKNSINQLVNIVNEHGVPTFSQTGSEEVKHGFMLSLSRAGYKYIGEYHARTFAKFFNGAEPNQLTQLFEAPTKMAINLKTAERVGFEPPQLLLDAADEIYREIQLPE